MCCWKYVLFGINALLLSANTFLLDDDQLTCYKCGDAGGDQQFPKCLDSPVTCKQGQVCQIQHGYRHNHHGPRIHCEGSNHCSGNIRGHIFPCPAGGVQVDTGRCQACCADSSCVFNMTSVLHLEMMASTNLFCPGRCHVNHPKSCIDTGRVCDTLDFCDVRIDHANQVTGKCSDDHKWNQCKHAQQQTPCPRGENMTNPSAYTHATSRHCQLDCCTTNQCLHENFGIHMATSVATRPGGNPSDITPGGSLWAQIHGYCADTFDDTLCQHLKNNHGICTNRLNISMCLKTCGVCDNIHSNACVDVGQCQTILQRNPSYCSSSPEAVFVCTKTCNLCSQLIDSVITSIIGGVTNLPPAVTTPSTLVNCDDLANFSCEHVGPLCSDTFLRVVCPDKCQLCSQPASITIG